MIQAEPWLERDQVMIDMLRSIGIEKGKPFAPDDASVSILNDAAAEARARFDVLYETIYEPHDEGARWFLPADKAMLEGGANGFTKTDSYPIDARGTVYYCAFSGVKHMGRWPVLSVRHP